MPSLRRFLAAGLLAVACTSFAATLPRHGRSVFRVWGPDDGLLNVTIECLAQDRAGFLWVGTQDGLYRLEGRSFRRFGNEDGLPSGRINTIHETADGRLYIGTRGGVARLHGDRFVAVSGLPDSPIENQSVASDSRGTLFVATTKGLYVATRGETFAREERLAASTTGALFVAADDTLFVAQEKKLYRRTGSGIEDFGAARGLAEGEPIDEVMLDGEGTLWVRTISTLSMLRKDAAAFVRVEEGLPPAISSGRLALDREGRILVPTKLGLAMRSGDGWGVVSRQQGLPADTVLAALSDREDSLWIGLAGSGLAQRLGTGAFTAWGKDEGLGHDVIWSIARERQADGWLWIGTEDGVNAVDPRTGELRKWGAGDGITGSAYALAAAPDGAIWIGTWPGGVTRIDRTTNGIRKFAVDDLPAAEFRVAALHFDRDGVLWAGARSGVYRFSRERERFERVALPGRQDPDTFWSFAESGGDLYAAGRFGLVRVTGAQQRWTKREGMRADFVASLGALPDGRLIVGYREPLGASVVRIDGSRAQFAPLEPMVVRKVLFLHVDARGMVWAGGDNGVDAVDLSRKRVRHFGRGEGLITEDMDQNAVLGEPDGTLWLGTSRGLVRYDRSTPERATPPPPILITSSIAGERSLQVHWAGLTYAEPSRVRFRYRLLPLETHFVETSQQEVRYPEVPPGQYRFEVLAVSAAGIVSTAPATLPFRVLPRWWQTWWASAIAIGAVLLLIVLLLRLRSRLAAARRELEEASLTDPLTGARNRRFFQSSSARRDAVYFMIDLDFFKQVNDELGHAAGDAVLVEAARRLQSCKREGDDLIRWGGEEFLLVDRHHDAHSAAEMARCILDAIAATPFKTSEGKTLHLTCSVGWAADPWPTESHAPIGPEEVLRLADRALYEAKASGRNCAIGVEPSAAMRGADLAAVWNAASLREVAGIAIRRIDGNVQGC